MAYQFTNPFPSYAFKPGMLYLGQDEQGREVGIQTERHAITIGGARSGKGAGLLIQNARRWTENLLMIDPKGENIALSWSQRKAMGQAVRVLDPFKVAEVPDHLRASFNPLGGIDINDLTAREEIEAISEGLVKVHDPRHMDWVNGARAILSGIMAYVIATGTQEARNFASVRTILLMPDNIEVEEGNEPQGLYAEAQRMLDCSVCGGLAKEAGLIIMKAIESDKGRERAYLSDARQSTRWLDAEPIAAALSGSSFDLAELKTGASTVALVLPPHLIKRHSEFLRLFVRYAIFVMAKGGSGKGRRCLFMLDEFFSLGKIEEIADAAGGLPSYGVHLWPFLQDLGQLQELYGVQGSETFFGNADAHIFLGNADMLTLEYISKRLGTLTPEEVAPPYEPPDPFGISKQVLEKLPLPPSKEWIYGRAGDGQQKTVWDEMIFKRTTREMHESHFNGFDEPPGPYESVSMRLAKRQDLIEHLSKRSAHEEARLKAAYEYNMRKVGSPRFTPSEVAALIGKGNGDIVARSMLVFAKAGEVLNLVPMPYFKEPPRTARQSAGEDRSADIQPVPDFKWPPPPEDEHLYKPASWAKHRAAFEERRKLEQPTGTAIPKTAMDALTQAPVKAKRRWWLF